MRKYIPLIIGYVIYASIVLIGIADIHHEYWQCFIFWIITIPLIVGSIVYIILKRKNKLSLLFPDNLDKEKNDKVFIKNWTLLDFAMEFGPKMQIKEFNDEKGKSYHLCRFVSNNNVITIVGFFSQLGDLTSQEILTRKNELFVGLTPSGKYYIHTNNVKSWETVSL